mgnify:CR=1 FL=1
MTIASRLTLGLCMFSTFASAVADGLVVTRNGAATAPFASTIWAGDTLYVAGMLPEATVPAGAPAGTRGTITGDTRAQTASTLQAIRKALASQGLGLGDIVQMRVYLVGDPAQDGRMDFAGMNAAYLEQFGTPDQPNKPVRATVQVAGLAVAGALVEIEVIAVRTASKK